VNCKLIVVANEAQLSEPVHEKAIPRSSCVYHLCQSFVTDYGDRNFLFSLLAEVSKQEKNASQSFLAGIKKLVHQVFLVPDFPCQQICHEPIGERTFAVDDIHHRFLIDSHNRAIGQCGCRVHAEKLSCEAAFSEEIAILQNPYRSFLTALRHNGEFYLSFLNIKTASAES